MNPLEINEDYDLNHTYTPPPRSNYGGSFDTFISESLIPVGEGFALTAMISYVFVHLSMNW